MFGSSILAQTPPPIISSLSRAKDHIREVLKLIFTMLYVFFEAHFHDVVVCPFMSIYDAIYKSKQMKC
jgi:hypothetical protein